MTRPHDDDPLPPAAAAAIPCDTELDVALATAARAKASTGLFADLSEGLAALIRRSEVETSRDNADPEAARQVRAAIATLAVVRAALAHEQERWQAWQDDAEEFCLLVAKQIDASAAEPALEEAA